jgi:hypothetical protein
MVVFRKKPDESVDRLISRFKKETLDIVKEPRDRKEHKTEAEKRKEKKAAKKHRIELEKKRNR